MDVPVGTIITSGLLTFSLEMLEQLSFSKMFERNKPAVVFRKKHDVSLNVDDGVLYGWGSHFFPPETNRLSLITVFCPAIRKQPP